MRFTIKYTLAKVWPRYGRPKLAVGSEIKLYFGKKPTVLIHLHGSVHHWDHRHHRQLAASSSTQFVFILKYSCWNVAITHVKVMKSQKHHVVHAGWMDFRNCFSLTHCVRECVCACSIIAQFPHVGRSSTCKKHVIPKPVSGSLETTKQCFSLNFVVHRTQFWQCRCCYWLSAFLS